MQYTRHESRDGQSLTVDRDGFVRGSGVQYQPQVTHGISRSRHERQRNVMHYPDGTIQASQDREWVELVTGGPGAVLRPYNRELARDSGWGIADLFNLMVCLTALVGGSFGALWIGTDLTGQTGWGVVLVAAWLLYFIYLIRKNS